MPIPAAYRVLAGALFLISAGGVTAQSSSITFTNTDLPPIPLLDSSSVEFDENGILNAQCVLDGEVCEGLGGLSSGDVPTVVLSRQGSGPIVEGGVLSVTWNVADAAVCVASSSPATGVTGWQGTLSAQGGTTQVAFSQDGTYTLEMVCYNDAGVSDPPGQLAVVVEEGEVPPPVACTIEDPLIAPAGFTRHQLTWEQMFLGASFPNTPSYLVPVGSWTLRSLAVATRGPAIAGRYLTVPFVPSTGRDYRISWLNAQTIMAAGYTNPRAADSVMVSISSCSGDFRRPNTFSTDPDLRFCRSLSNTGVLSFGTNTSSFCRLTPGQTYWLNIAFANPAGGLTTTEHTCSGTEIRCEANFTN
jgi:hypothetical protein